MARLQLQAPPCACSCRPQLRFEANMQSRPFRLLALLLALPLWGNCPAAAATGRHGKLSPCSLEDPWASGTSDISYTQTYDLVTAMMSSLSKRSQHSWLVEWSEMDSQHAAHTAFDADPNCDLHSTLNSSCYGRPARSAVAVSGQHAATTIRQRTTAGPLLHSLTECVNAAYNRGAGVSALSYDGVAEGTLPELKAVAGWWRTENKLRMPATVVTFSSIGRIDQLRAQCLAWPGPLSAVLYQPLLQQSPGVLTEHNKGILRIAVLRMMHLVAQMERQPGACQLNLLLVYEIIRDELALPLLPLNALRNLARLQVRTPLSVLLDVDLLPSRSLFKRLADWNSAKFILKRALQRELFIMPAFELTKLFNTLAWADTLVTSPSMNVMRSMLQERVVMQFQEKQYMLGHNLTDYTKWLSADADYTVKYVEGAEPWVVGPTQLMPWSDERYRGYGRDKVQLMNTMQKWNYTVLHDVYVIHRPHRKNIAMINTTATSKYKGASLIRRINVWYREQKSILRSGQEWQSPTSLQLQHCLTQLPWWNKRRKLIAST